MYILLTESAVDVKERMSTNLNQCKLNAGRTLQEAHCEPGQTNGHITRDDEARAVRL
jgi:hypothetical protein